MVEFKNKGLTFNEYMCRVTAGKSSYFLFYMAFVYIFASSEEASKQLEERKGLGIKTEGTLYYGRTFQTAKQLKETV